MAHAIAAALDAERFHTLHPFLAELPDARFPDLVSLNELAARHELRNAGGLPLRFVAPAEGTYEQTIYVEGAVPTRPDSWHDLFNALAWCAFPQSKALLNRLHVERLREPRPANGRGAARDVLTLFDESGVVIACKDPDLAQLLKNFSWKELFYAQRERLRAGMSFHIVGHAIHEQLLRPFDGITAKGIVFDVDPKFFAWDARQRLRHLDELTAAYFSDPQNLERTRSLQPVPVLGIPDWWPANEDARYYDNLDYFRPRRER